MDADHGSTESSKELLKEEIVGLVEPDIQGLGLPEQSRRKVEKVVQQAVGLTTEITAYHGPLPPPSMMAEYEKVVPGFSQKLVESFIKEGDHRRQSESAALNAAISRAERGQWLGGALAVFFGCIALYLGDKGHDWLAGGVFTGTIISIIVVFVLGQRPDRAPEEPSEDAPEEKEPPRAKTPLPKPSNKPKKPRKR